MEEACILPMASIIFMVLEISRDSCWRLVSGDSIRTQAGTAYVHRRNPSVAKLPHPRSQPIQSFLGSHDQSSHHHHVYHQISLVFKKISQRLKQASDLSPDFILPQSCPFDRHTKHPSHLLHPHPLGSHLRQKFHRPYHLLLADRIPQ